jgi:hypothetical protein
MPIPVVMVAADIDPHSLLVIDRFYGRIIRCWADAILKGRVFEAELNHPVLAPRWDQVLGKAGGFCLGRAGTAKGWLRIGVSDNEILFHRLDFARSGILSARSPRLPLERP